MPVYVGLLRAVNVLGTRTLPMAALRRACLSAGFARPETYIASGNVVFETDLDEADAKGRLERELANSGPAIDVLLRTGAGMAAVRDGDPFPDAPRNFAYALFLPRLASAADVAAARGLSGERLELGGRELYIAYPNGMGRSKLRLPAMQVGTARNMNTVAKLAAMALAR